MALKTLWVGCEPCGCGVYYVLSCSWRQHQRVCEQWTGSGGSSGSAPFPVTQQRHRCDWTAGKGGKKKARGRQERGETTGDWGINAPDDGIYTPFDIGRASVFFPPAQTVVPVSQSCCFTNTPPFSRLSGWTEESRPNQWPFDRSSSGRPGTAAAPVLFWVVFFCCVLPSFRQQSTGIW